MPVATRTFSRTSSRPVSSPLRSTAIRWGFAAALAAGLAAVPVGAALASSHGGRSPASHDSRPRLDRPAAAPTNHGPGDRSPHRPTAVPADPTATPTPPPPVGPFPWPWGQALHGRLTLATRDAGVQTVTLQRGTVTGVGAGTVTISSADGFEATWAVTDGTRVTQPNGRRVALGVGQEVGAWGGGDPSTPTARFVVVRHRLSSPPSDSPTASPTDSPTDSPTATPTDPPTDAPA